MEKEDTQRGGFYGDWIEVATFVYLTNKGECFPVV
jgi:hypothetical protein